MFADTQRATTAQRKRPAGVIEALALSLALILVSGIRCTGYEDPTRSVRLELNSFTATPDGDDVFIEWRTGNEQGNLGFHLYRSDGNERTRLTPSLVAGSSLFVGPETLLAGGRTYHWRDSASKQRAQYWLEAIDINGQHTWHGPVGVYVRSFERSKLRASPPVRLPAALGSRTESGNPGRLNPVERRAPGREATRSAIETQWALAAKPAVKIGVREEGWYRIGQPELVAAGLNADADPRRLQLFAGGEEQPMLVEGKSDRRFEAISFYGLGLDTLCSDTRVYWLTEGSTPGKRVSVSQNRKRKSAVVAGSFPMTVETRDRSIYFAALLNGDADNFFGPPVTADGVEETLLVEHLDPSQTGATLTITLQGLTNDVTHSVMVEMNGRPVGSVSLVGQTWKTVQISLAPGLLREGLNTVRLQALGGQADVSLIDTIQITYPHMLVADEGSLRFTWQARGPVTVTGFLSSSVWVVDVSDAGNPELIRCDGERSAAGYTITIDPTGNGEVYLLAFSAGLEKHPVFIERNEPSAWHAADNRADIVIITHPSFRDAILPLQMLRESQGYRTAVVDVDQVYDEFSFGTKSAEAIRTFLMTAANNWRLRPRFALLVGDASFDPRDYMGAGGDFVPTKLVETPYLETASDGWFADPEDSGVPLLAIGRLPVQTVEQAANAVRKIVSYERDAGRGVWKHSALLIADVNDGPDLDFEQATRSIRSLIPPALDIVEVLRSQVADVGNRTISEINNGKDLVHYVGHGYVQGWRGSIDTSDAMQLNNARLPLVLANTCLNGLFQDPASASLAEGFMNAPDGGAIAVLASSAMFALYPQQLLDQEFTKQVFSASTTIGEAALRAKAATFDRRLRQTYNLFGDPVTRLRIQ